jgi:ubiquitin-like protein Pup
MAGQEQRRDATRDDESDTPVPLPSRPASAQDDAVDALLDEIDEVLETNAESFVRGFVQKGGQ